MMQYGTSKGCGYNPLCFMKRDFSEKTWLFQISGRNRSIAALNIFVSLSVLVVSTLYLSTEMLLTAYSMIGISIGLICWHIMITIARGKETLVVNETPASVEYRVFIFTVEWVIYYLSVSLFLTSIRTLELPGIADTGLTVLVAAAVLLMLLPVAEASRYLLTKK